MVKLAIIGGRILDAQQMLPDAKEVYVETPYGRTSSGLLEGKFNDVDIVILYRHGKEDILPPSQINYQANIFALQHIGCTHIIAINSVGSLTEELVRGQVIVPNQFIDFTRDRKTTFHDTFQPNMPVHTKMLDPFSHLLRELISSSAELQDIKVEAQGTIVTVEGPRFSTKAEVKMFTTWGAHVIDMVSATECILAKEARIPYAVLGVITNYDTLDDPALTKDIVSTEMQDEVTKIIHELIPRLE
ncbi:MTAP family purine nucleoside phosphorylase [Candidatus Woesearchaeota archaeon]|nr:MTAP family purine nucleoside phosphorylase [Candidatus Woesearchaeota archaeon]